MRRLPAVTGMNAIFADFLTSVATSVQRQELSERETDRLGAVALDLAAAALAEQVDAEDQLAPETRRQALLARIEAFIEVNLRDADLTPAEIAAHHHISLAYLHRRFQPRELTVTAWIRHQRLARCRVDLADPRLRTRPVHALAARWGFRHASDFSRAFRTAQGVSPSEYRDQALSEQGWPLGRRTVKEPATDCQRHPRPPVTS
ncbi:helix-turn-helix transcriptional regulator [Streptomyces sp. NPDC047081]|uniref:helix-turn-helix transcriptional regulator n=1 Tax=Streptomyces sp. NPDC047081 TaxID=3154706 RepID=UPI0033D0ACD8